MKFDVEKRERNAKYDYTQEEFDIAREFTKRIYQEFGDFIKAVVLFGSVAKRVKLEKEADIDILVIVDDVRIKFSKELVQTYRIILEKIILDVEPKRLHLQSMKFTSFWEYIRAGDPVAINMLRYGIALIDTGFFDPLQALLDEGRIRPSKESIYTYYAMAPASLQRSKTYMLNAIVDLYWACIDSAHAALMSFEVIPPSPEHVGEMLRKYLRKEGLKDRNIQTMEHLYILFKKIAHRDIKEISGKDYDKYMKRAIEFIDATRRLIEKERKR